MILGSICTRACKFCSVNTGKPDLVDKLEPYRVSQAIKEVTEILRQNHRLSVLADNDFGDPLICRIFVINFIAIDERY